MIQLYTGVPGAGKTYKMVSDLAAFLEKEPDINLVSNIRGLKLPHEDFDGLLAEYFPDKSLTIPQRIEKFFDYDFQKSLNDFFGGPIMYILDECQLYFPRRTSLPVTEAYLQRHRHLGHYLYLATQSSKLINSNIVALIEIEYYAVRRSISFFGEMHYRVKSPQGNQIIEKFAVRPRKKIFELYKSFEAEEITKPKKKLWLKLWPLALLPLAAFVFYDRVLNTDKKLERLRVQHGLERSAEAAAPPVPSAAPSGFADTGEVERLRTELDNLRRQVNDKERVFLTVVKTENSLLTIDPDTQAVVALESLNRKVICLRGGLRCYYDRPVNSGVKVADTSGRGGSTGGPGASPDSLPSGSSLANAALRPGNPNADIPGLPSAGSSGSFVEPSMVPPPERVRLKVYNGLED